MCVYVHTHTHTHTHTLFFSHTSHRDIRIWGGVVSHLFVRRYQEIDTRYSILKGRDVILLTKVCKVKAMVFPVFMYRCESWTIKKAEHRRIDAFKLWCWRRLLRVHWTARRSNLLILKDINPEYLLEGLMLKLKLKLQFFGHLM